MSSITDLCKRINEDLATSVATKTFWTTKIMVNGDKCVYRDYPEIEVEYEDLIKMFDEDSYSKVIGELRKPVVEPPVVAPPVAEVTPINNQVNNGLKETRDMLAPTVVMDPVNEDSVVPEAPAEQEETERAVVTELPVETQSMPNKMVKKPLTFTKPTPKVNKQAGFAEVIALGVIVLVYIAIIVNLIIRLK